MASRSNPLFTLISFLLLAALCFGAYLWFNGDLVVPAKDPGPKGFLKTEQELRDKMAELQLQREEVTSRIARLEDGKMKALAKLKEKGVTSSSDLDLTDLEVKGWIQEIHASRRSIKLLEEGAERYTTVISRIEARLDDILRKEITAAVTISDEEDLELRRIVAHAEEELGLDKTDILQEEEWAKILDAEMSNEEKDE